MRFTKRHRRRDNGDESILPLTNVVFLLLIFFMLAGQISGPDAFQINPPVSESEANADTRGLEIEIASSGSIALDGQSVSLDELTDRAGEKLGGDSNTPIRVKADGAGDATRVVAVMKALRQAGAQKLRLITIVSEPR